MGTVSIAIGFFILAVFPTPGAAQTNKEEFCHSESDYFELAINATGQTEPLVTWQEAEHWCHRHDMTLPILSSTSARMEFERFIKRNDFVFRDIWLGGQMSMDEDWRWLNGSSLENLLQLTQESSCLSNQSNHGLVKYYSNGSYVFESDCSSRGHNFICQYEERPKNGQQKADFPCRNGKERCVIAYTGYRQLPWYLARNFCVQKGGDLATDISALKDIVSSSSSSSSNPQYFWIGLRKTEWTWSNGADVKETLFRDDSVDNFGDCLFAVRDKQWQWDSCTCTNGTRRNLIICQKNRSIVTDCQNNHKPEEHTVSGLLAAVAILSALDVALVVITLRLSKKLASHKCRKEHETSADINQQADPSAADILPAPERDTGDYTNEGETTAKKRVFMIAGAAAFPADAPGGWAGLAAAAQDGSYLTPSWLRQASVISSVKYETFIYADANSGSSPGSVEVSTRILTDTRDSHVYLSLDKEEGEQVDWIGSRLQRREAQERPGNQQVMSPDYVNNSDVLSGRIRQKEERKDIKEEPSGSTVQVLRSRFKQLLHPPRFRNDDRKGQGSTIPGKVSASTADVSVQESSSVPGHGGLLGGDRLWTAKRPGAEKREGVLWTETSHAKEPKDRTHEKLRSLPSVPGNSWSKNESAIGY